MIADDTISKMLTILAALITIYLTCIENALSLVITPVILLLVGDFLQRFTLGNIPDVDSVVGSGPQVELTRKKILLYTVVSVMAIAFSGIAIKKAFISQQTGLLSILGATSFGILMAISEERFFRKWATNFFVSRFGNLAVVGFVLSATFFTVYHFGRYGTDLSAVLYVFAGGLILSFVAWYSGRLSPVVLAHVINNVAATADLSLLFTTETLMLVAVMVLIYVAMKAWGERRK